MARGVKAGEAFYRLSLDDRQLRQSLDKTTKLIRNMARAIAGIFASAAITRAFTGFIKRAEELGHVADRLGIAVDKLSELQFAAKQSGVEVNALNMALQRMVRRISEAAAGGGEALGAIERLGLDPRALAALSPDQQLMQVADALAGVANQGERVRLAFKFFDSEGVALLQVLNEGSEGLKRYAAEARSLGAVIDKEASDQARELADAWGRVQASIDGLMLQVGGAAAPVLTQVFDELTEIIKAVRMLGKESAIAAALLGENRAKRSSTLFSIFRGGIQGAGGAVGADKLVEKILGASLEEINRELVRDARLEDRRIQRRLELSTAPSPSINRIPEQVTEGAFTSRSGFGVAATADVFGTIGIGQKQLDIMRQQLDETKEQTEILKLEKELEFR